MEYVIVKITPCSMPGCCEENTIIGDIIDQNSPPKYDDLNKAYRRSADYNTPNKFSSSKCLCRCKVKEEL